MTLETFDLNSWKKQGEDALATLQEREAELVDALQEIRVEMEGLKKVLGINSNGKRTRVRIRPAIVQVLNTHGSGATLEQVIVWVKEIVPLGTKASIEKAIRRFILDTDECELIDGKICSVKSEDAGTTTTTEISPSADPIA